MYLASEELIAQISDFSISKVSAEVRAQFDKFQVGIAESASESSRIMSVTGSNAEIMITGVLTKKFTLMTWLMGGTAYTDIVTASEALAADDSITNVTLRLDSGGGVVNGMIQAANAIKSIKDSGKKLTAIVDGVCGSACYILAAQCDEILAVSDGEMIGSIGAQGVYGIDDEGRVTIRGTNSFNKNPDPSKDGGTEAARNEVDQFESLYLESIANGRGVSVEYIKSNYGNGAIFSAKTALEKGIIDGIMSKSTNQGVPDSTVTASNEDPLMNIAELKAKHPDLYAEVLALGESSGKQSEKERVSAFVELGAASGANDLMMACIKDGTEHSATVTARFSAAQMTNMQLAAMAQDNPDVSGINAEQPEGQEQVSASEKAALDLAAQMEVDLNA